MLIKNLFSLFGGSYQTGRSDNASPDVIEEKESKVIIPEKFKDDIERLESYCGVELRSGLCIEIELSELLEILPRERRRKDSYDKLVKFLADEMNIKLNIKPNNFFINTSKFIVARTVYFYLLPLKEGNKFPST